MLTIQRNDLESRMRQIINVAICALLLGGCVKPSPVQVVEDSSVLEPTTLQSVDPNFDYKAVDSTGVLPADQQAYYAYLLISDIKFNGAMGERGLALSTVLLGDRTSPVQNGGRVFGYSGLLVRSLLLNGQAMVPVPHVVNIRPSVTVSDSSVRAGFEYLLNLTPTYVPNQVYTWTISPLGFDSTTISILTPDTLEVLTPHGGSMHSRGEDLNVRWSGTGNLLVILSATNPVTGRTKPLVSFRPLRGQDHATIRGKLLESLPAGSYALTFILANRTELPSGKVHPGKVLVQASSLYTTFFGLKWCF
jgi:hypothetical protein